MPPGLAIDSMKIALVRGDIAASKLGEVVGVGEDDLPAEILDGMAELVDRAAIEPLRRDDLVARLQSVWNTRSCAAWPDADRERRGAAFERGDALLEHRGRRIHDARVDVAEAFRPKSEAACSTSLKTKDVVW